METYKIKLYNSNNLEEYKEIDTGIDSSIVNLIQDSINSTDNFKINIPSFDSINNNIIFVISENNQIKYKLILEKFIKENDNDYSPYCKVCNACGEDGCCSALNCSFEKGCEYKNIYLAELREGYLFTKEFYNKIYNKLTEDLKKEVNQIFDEI